MLGRYSTGAYVKLVDLLAETLILGGMQPLRPNNLAVRCIPVAQVYNYDGRLGIG